MKCRAMTRIMQFCMLLVVVVSAFFYAPMEVSASGLDIGLSDVMDQSLDNTINLDGAYYQLRVANASQNFNFSGHINESLVDDNLYKVKLATTAYLSSNNTGYIQQFSVRLGVDFSLLFTSSYYLNANNQNTFNQSSTKEFILSGAQLKQDYVLNTSYIYRRSSDATVTVGGAVGLDLVSVEMVKDANASDYENGYNAGYSAGEAQGFNSGYQSGLDAGYDSGFEEGKNSVDTDSYYQAGYSAGYDAAYSVGFEEGYDEAYEVAYADGYASAMDRIESWGADTSDYPILVFDDSVSQPSVHVDCMSNIPGTSYGSTSLFHLDFNVNPNHTYKFVFNSQGFYTDLYDCLFGDTDLGYVVGNLRIPASYNTSWRTNTVFIPGDCFSSVVKLDAYVYEMRYYGGVNESDDLNLAIGAVVFGTHGNVSLKVYDMGPTGDTQNHIANQTDQLTNGYDSSQGAAVNDDFKASVNEYHTAEDSLFSTATTSLENFTFLDFTSITGMVTSLSFVTSIMTSIYMAMGGDTGASGIILAVLFSVMLVSMAIGLYRYYVSNGKSDGSGKGGD